MTHRNNFLSLQIFDALQNLNMAVKISNVCILNEWNSRNPQTYRNCSAVILSIFFINWQNIDIIRLFCENYDQSELCSRSFRMYLRRNKVIYSGRSYVRISVKMPVEIISIRERKTTLSIGSISIMCFHFIYLVNINWKSRKIKIIIRIKREFRNRCVPTFISFVLLPLRLVVFVDLLLNFLRFPCFIQIAKCDTHLFQFCWNYLIVCCHLMILFAVSNHNLFDIDFICYCLNRQFGIQYNVTYSIYWPWMKKKNIETLSNGLDFFPQ